MLTPHCQDACDKQGALGAAAGVLHRTCPGAYLTTDGRRHGCTCDCHEGQAFPGLDQKASRGPLPVLADPPGADAPANGDKSTKRPRRGLSRGASNPCQCGCGTLVVGRFQPGHDAKLKSRLTRDAERGDDQAWAELELRNWAALVSPQRVDAAVREAGRGQAQQAPADWLERRVAERHSRNQT